MKGWARPDCSDHKASHTLRGHLLARSDSQIISRLSQALPGAVAPCGLAPALVPPPPAQLTPPLRNPFPGQQCFPSFVSKVELLHGIPSSS